MKKLILMLVFMVLVFSSGCSEKTPKAEETALTVPPIFAEAEKEIENPTYKDGTYHYEGQVNTEGYTTRIDFTITDGKLSALTWDIYDDIRDRVFDETYYEVYEGNALYVHQCETDLVGYNAYGDLLVEAQAGKDKLDKNLIKDVDIISGATWTYQMLKSAFVEAIKLAAE